MLGYSERVFDSVFDELVRSAVIRSEIELNELIMMPDHFHGIMVCKGNQQIAKHTRPYYAPTD